MAHSKKIAGVVPSNGDGSLLSASSLVQSAEIQRQPPAYLPLVSESAQGAYQPSFQIRERETAVQFHHEAVHIRTKEHLQFVDLTEVIYEVIRKPGIQNGFVNVQTQHTTTAIMVNENEPLLLEDMKRMLESMVPRDGEYQHDNFTIRTANLCPDERENGHSHCQAMLLRASETVNVLGGRLQLGRWQRIFFVELDGTRDRVVSIMVMGL